MLKGKKTYLTAAVLLVAVAVEKGLGLDVPGLTVDENWLVVVMNAIGLGSLRSALNK
jgi:hypothetical protein